MPSLYRHLVLADAQRIAQSFKLSMSLVHRCATYQHIRDRRFFFSGRHPCDPAAAPAIDVPPDLPQPRRLPEPMQVTSARGGTRSHRTSIAKAIAAASAPGLDHSRPPMIQ